MEHCITCDRPSNEKTVLLILDNHESHLKISPINVAKAINIFLLTLLHRSPHKLLLLDCTIIGPYRTYDNYWPNDWLLSNAGKKVTICSVAGTVGKCFSKTFTKHNIEKGFHVTGFYPLNDSPFCADEFLSSYVNDRICRTSQVTFKLHGQQ